MKPLTITNSFYLLSAMTIVCLATFFTSKEDTIEHISVIGLSMLSLLWIAFTYVITRREYRSNNNLGKSDLMLDNITFNKIYGFIESSIKEDLDVVRSETAQVKSLIGDAVATLGKSFSEMNTNVQDQYILISQLTNAAQSGNNLTIFSQIDEKTKQIKINAADAVRSLQFEDIAVQVTDNSIQYLDNIERYLDKCKSQLEDLSSLNSQNSQAADVLQLVAGSLQQIRQQHRLPERKAANQHDLAEGGIELF
jgi:hypothetical protein